MGKIFDTYFHFGIIGDCYLGRNLAGLDPNTESFAQVPPISNVMPAIHMLSEQCNSVLDRY